jgi:hypothetical protein
VPVELVGARTSHTGDVLIGKLGEALNTAQYAILLVSRSYLEKAWTKAEMETLLHRFFENRSLKIIPVLIGLDRGVLVDEVPMMRNIVPIDFTDIEDLQTNVLRTVLPFTLKPRASSRQNSICATPWIIAAS